MRSKNGHIAQNHISHLRLWRAQLEELRLFSVAAYLAIPFQLCCAFKHVFAREQGVGSVFTGADHPERGEWSVLPLVFLDRLLGLKEPGTGRDSIGTIAKRDIHCSKGSWSDSNA